MKTSELIGAALDWAVAKCEGHVENGVYGEPVLCDGQLHIHYCGVVLEDIWCPSTNWSQGGPIIEREKINLRTEDEDDGDNDWQWVADPQQAQDLTCRRYGDTPLTAAMRCFVASKLGDEVAVPKELL